MCKQIYVKWSGLCKSMSYTRIVIVFLGFGASMVGMSFVKKLFRRKTTKLSKDNVSETGMSPTLGVISNESLIEFTHNKANLTEEKELNVVPSTSSSSENSDSPINKRVRQNRQTLNSVLRKYRYVECVKYSRRVINITTQEILSIWWEMRYKWTTNQWSFTNRSEWNDIDKISHSCDYDN